jgi:hypothetical protein
MSLKIVNQLSDVESLLNKPYNRPAFTDKFKEGDFEREYTGVYEKVRQRLELFGEVSNFGKRGLSLGPPTKSRKIGIVIDSDEYFRPEIIQALMEVLNSSPEDYLIYIDGEDDAENEFYICLTKGREPLAYAANAESLEPFLE